MSQGALIWHEHEHAWTARRTGVRTHSETLGGRCETPIAQNTFREGLGGRGRTYSKLAESAAHRDVLRARKR